MTRAERARYADNGKSSIDFREKVVTADGVVMRNYQQCKLAVSNARAIKMGVYSYARA